MKIIAKSGHTLDITAITADQVPTWVKLKRSEYTHFYEVRNWDRKGVVFFYMAKGYSGAGATAKGAREIHVWYRNGQMWSGYGKNFQTAIDSAQRDGWLHAA